MNLHKIATSISNSSVGRVHTAGRIEFVKDQGPLRRDVRVHDFDWDQSSHNDLAKILWAVQRSHSYAIAAYRILSKMSSSRFSPDGLLGGKGYIQNIKDMRSNLANASEFLSSFADTLHDEISAPHWRSAAAPETEELVQDSQEIKQNPEGFVEEEFEEEIQPSPSEPEVYVNPDASTMNPTVENPGEEDDEEDGGFFQTSSRQAGGNSSLPVETLSGPRVTQVGPGEGPGFEGSFNPPEDWPSDNMDIEKYPGFGDYDLAYPVNYDSTDGDSSSFKFKKKKNKEAASTYSWLPGADNDRPLDFYRRGLTEKEILLMKSIADPTKDMTKESKKSFDFHKGLWER
jgi:hypothetical protein